MARLPRFDVPGQSQHVIKRGNDRSVTFFGEEYYQFYLKKNWRQGNTNVGEVIGGLRKSKKNQSSLTPMMPKMFPDPKMFPNPAV